MQATGSPPILSWLFLANAIFTEGIRKSIFEPRRCNPIHERTTERGALCERLQYASKHVYRRGNNVWQKLLQLWNWLSRQVIKIVSLLVYCRLVCKWFHPKIVFMTRTTGEREMKRKRPTPLSFFPKDGWFKDITWSLDLFWILMNFLLVVRRRLTILYFNAMRNLTPTCTSRSVLKQHKVSAYTGCLYQRKTDIWQHWFYDKTKKIRVLVEITTK